MTCGFMQVLPTTLKQELANAAALAAEERRMMRVIGGTSNANEVAALLAASRREEVCDVPTGGLVWCSV